MATASRHIRRRAPSRSQVQDYAEFRTGLTFREVYALISNRRWKRRHGVLGKWREIKLAMYARHCEGR